MSRTCAIPSCDRAVKPGRVVCFDHRNTEEGKNLLRQLKHLATALTDLQTHPLDQSVHARQTRKLATKIGRGDYTDLLKPTLAQLAESAEQTREISRLIGISQYAIAAQIELEPDPWKMGNTIARNVDNISTLLRLLHNERKLHNPSRRR